MKCECEDCGKPYSEFELDTVLPNGQWELICSGRRHELLCANCIVVRASKIPGCTVAHMVLEIYPIGVFSFV